MAQGGIPVNDNCVESFFVLVAASSLAEVVDPGRLIVSFAAMDIFVCVTALGRCGTSVIRELGLLPPALGTRA